MSTVAWDGRIVALDRKGTFQGTASLAQKWRELPDGRIAVWTGGLAVGSLLAEWLERGALVAEWPEFQKDKDDWANLFYFVPGEKPQAYYYERPCFAVRVAEKIGAWGSGMDFAYGAMDHGATAIQAVRIANKRDNGSGCGVAWFDMVTGEHGVEGDHAWPWDTYTGTTPPSSGSRRR